MSYYLAGEQSTVSYVSRGLVIACIIIHIITDVVYILLFCYS